MLFGFISLLLTFWERPISKICISKSVGSTFLPCKNAKLPDDSMEEPTCQKKVRSMWSWICGVVKIQKGYLIQAYGLGEQGKISLLSRNGVNQLHVLIFLLAFFHVLSCVITLGLGMAKVISQGNIYISLTFYNCKWNVYSVL